MFQDKEQMKFFGYKKYLGFGQNLQKQQIHGVLSVDLWIANNSILNQFNIVEARRYTKFANDSVLGEAMHSYLPVFIGLSKGMSLAERQIFDLQNKRSCTHAL